jgi:hypothetical protein
MQRQRLAQRKSKKQQARRKCRPLHLLEEGKKTRHCKRQKRESVGRCVGQKKKSALLRLLLYCRFTAALPADAAAAPLY